MIIGNGKLITNDEANPFIENGAVLVKDNVIEDVGDYADLKAKYPNEDIVDVKGRVIMPGMICAHTHVYSTYARGMGTSKPTDNFYNVLENLWWALDKKLTLEDVKLNGYVSMIDSIRNGCTTMVDHHAGPNSVEGSLFTLAEVAKDVGMRTSLCYEVTDRDGVEIAEKGIKENVDFIKACQKDDHGDMIHGLFGLHASFTVSDDTLYKAQEAMAGVYNGYHVHVAEGIEDQYECLKKHGKRVVHRLHDFGILNDQTIAVHCVHVNQAEIDTLKETDCSIVHNPESNMNNAIGCPPIVHMIKQGLRVGLGTDAMTNDMFESMKVCNILQSHQNCDPTVGFMETMAMQFVNNPKILAKYFKKDIGMIKKGAYADIITLDYEPHTPLNGDNWFGHALFGMTGRIVNDTMINGKFLMRNREILVADTEAIWARSRERASEIWPLM